MKTKKAGASDPCADGCRRGCEHDRVTKDYTTTKHTPGPWKLDTATANKANGGMFGVIEDTEEGNGVAECYSREDARLIAAAPDLLEALKTAQSALEVAYQYENTTEGPAMPYGSAIDAVRAAIAKAEGK